MQAMEELEREANRRVTTLEVDLQVIIAFFKTIVVDLLLSMRFDNGAKGYNSEHHAQTAVGKMVTLREIKVAL